MQTGAKKVGVVVHERVSHSKNRGRSHHVEVVLSRIFAKQRACLKQKTLRSVDLENAGADWR
jgi:hypothetical protein